MSLSSQLFKVLNEWLNAKTETFKDHSLARFIRNNLVSSLKEIISDSNYLISGHPGMGNWADVPWLGILDKNVTTSGQEGIYITYLFKSDASGVYLSLQQGAERLKAAEIPQKISEIRTYFRQNIEQFKDWNMGDIDLSATNVNSKKYERTNIASKYYSLNNIPSDNQLKSDLISLKSLYMQASRLESKNDILKTYTPNSKLSFQSIPKPFLILAGISGTGKTRFVREQAMFSGKTDNYCLVSVRPDWHEPSDLLGYISHLNKKPKYIATDVLRFIVEAWKHIAECGFNFETNEVTAEQLELVEPYWLCLDEMNLAPVEQYFADYLSVLETRVWNEVQYRCDPLLKRDAVKYIQATDIGLNEDDMLWQHFKEKGISIPFNLIVAGTVNMDETTHGFSRKVLDRALSFDFNEFYPNDFNHYFSSPVKVKALTYPIYSDARISVDINMPPIKASCDFLSEINQVLKGTPFELAYRALNELLLSVKCVEPKDDDITLQSVWDDFLMMKVLPRIEGDAEKLDFDGEDSLLIKLKNVMQVQLADIWEGKTRLDLFRENSEGEVIKIECRSKAKVDWMQGKLAKFGFTHFWK